MLLKGYDNLIMLRLIGVIKEKMLIRRCNSLLRGRFFFLSVIFSSPERKAQR